MRSNAKRQNIRGFDEVVALAKAETERRELLKAQRVDQESKGKIDGADVPIMANAGDIQPETSTLLSSATTTAQKKTIKRVKLEKDCSYKAGSTEELVQGGYKGAALEIDINYLMWGKSQKAQINGVP